MKYKILLALLLPSVCFAEPMYQGKVLRVIDGDTIKVEMSIRLAQIDCPESKQRDGNLATEELKKHVEGKRVRLRFSKSGAYMRPIAQVIVKDQQGYYPVNELLVKDGLCWTYPRTSTPKLDAYQEAARVQRIGIWANEKEPLEPWLWRKQKKGK